MHVPRRPQRRRRRRWSPDGRTDAPLTWPPTVSRAETGGAGRDRETTTKHAVDTPAGLSVSRLVCCRVSFVSSFVGSRPSSTRRPNCRLHCLRAPPQRDATQRRPRTRRQRLTLPSLVDGTSGWSTSQGRTGRRIANGGADDVAPSSLPRRSSDGDRFPPANRIIRRRRHRDSRGDGTMRNTSWLLFVTNSRRMNSEDRRR